MALSPIFEQRKIEARLVKAFHERLVEELGKTRAETIIADILRDAAIAQGREFAEGFDHEPNLADMESILHNWTSGGALEIEVKTAKADVLRFDVRRCRFAEMYKDMGLGDIGHLLSCQRDGAFCIGFNDKIKFTRSQTIMQGASHCDFHYRLGDDAEAEEPEADSA